MIHIELTGSTRLFELSANCLRPSTSFSIFARQ
jgi:hypothetical protein